MSELATWVANEPSCAACGGAAATIFYEVGDVPAESRVLAPTREEALAAPRADVRLAFCRSCGFIWNTLFDPAKVDYSHGYDSALSYSPTFEAFAGDLARWLVERHGLHGKDVLEIGCGEGEFLAELCSIAGGYGIGIDPSYGGTRHRATPADRLSFIADRFGEHYTGLGADLICTLRTIEHIGPVAEFFAMLRSTAEERPNTPLFIEVADAMRVLREAAFWDISYERCSYFTIGSLSRLLRSQGFVPTYFSEAFGDQYLLMEAVLHGGSSGVTQAEQDLAMVSAQIGQFDGRMQRRLDAWHSTLDEIRARGQRAVVWGAGSNGVAFLTTLGAAEEVAAVVDMNPRKQGRFTPGTGHAVVAPRELKSIAPDVVIVMDSIDLDEIAASLANLRLAPSILTVEEPWPSAVPA